MKKIVGITCGRTFKDGSPHREYQNTAYCVAVAAAGALAVLLPVSDPAAANDYLDRIDGLLLPGGIDVNPHHYGRARHPQLGETDEGQDLFEIAIAREAWRRRMPILAICRGIQLLNVALGGTLIQDLPSDCPSELVHRQTAERPVSTHEVIVDCESRLFRLTGQTMSVNSFHHQAVDTPGSELRVAARSADGVIEALESDVHPRVIAVQCHPEETAIHDAKSQALFRQFVAWL